MFKYVPNTYISQKHIIFCTIIALSSYADFVYLCFSDPGIINKNNLNYYRKKYNFDKVMYQGKDW